MSRHALKQRFEPSVPQVILDQANAVEAHTLKALSVLEQQNNAQVEVLISVEEQTIKTNGRVKQHDTDLALLHKRLTVAEQFVAATTAYRRRMLAAILLSASIISPLVYTLLNEWLLKALHLK